jgi:hypothetical protein
MQGKTKAFLLFSAFLLTMCKNYAGESITYRNGLSCQNYVDHRFFEWQGQEYQFYVREEGADCSYMCPDGTIRETNVVGSISSMYAASQEELDGQFCGIATATATPEPSVTAPATLTAASSPTPTRTPAGTASPTTTAPVISAPVLSGDVSMCDLGGKLINFRILESAPDLTGRTLEVRIAEQESRCYVNPTNQSLLTCTIPNDISFPASIVVTLDGALVNNFEYNGLGCTILTTPTPSKGRSYP